MTDQPTIIIIIGITGDLAKRYLLPAIDEIARAKVIPQKFQIVGITRRPDVKVDDLTKAIKDPMYVNEHTELFQMNLDESGEYKRLDEYLKKIEDRFGKPTQRLFYLSVPPQVSQRL